MGFYFDDHLSMFGQAGMQVERTLECVVRRYVGANPPTPPTYRAYNRAGGILRGKDYRYHADFNALLPGATAGQFVYAWAKIWSDADAPLRFDINCVCPTVLWLNQQVAFRSDIFQERYFDERVPLTLPLKPGWNHFVLRFRKTSVGFGGIFGTWLGKLPYYFLLPDPARDGQEGWLYSEPTRSELAAVPGAGTTPADTGLTWLPRQEWPAADRARGQMQRLFGTVAGCAAFGWTKAFFQQPGTAEYSLTGRAVSPLTVFVAGQPVFATSQPGPLTARIKVPFGEHDVFVQSVCQGADWGYELALSDAAGPVRLANPARVVGATLDWIYAGPVAATAKPDFAALTDLNRLVAGLAGESYWRLDLPETWVRPYNTNALYGRWNYPLGVTLYGLLHSAKAIGSVDTQDYLRRHIQYSCDTFHYAMWDKQQYGGATNVHHLLTSIDSLDDCGSFGSCLLEVAKHLPVAGWREIADFVASYISTKQIRLPDGTFFRKHLMHSFHEDTMWADDLYMSVPFLCRYYQLTGETRYIDDAARQFLGFKKLLYIEATKVFAHVFDFKRGRATGIPWGRGNGWTIFSLSELLAVLPASHPLRPDLIQLFRDLSAGFLALQDENGMWHQVLTEHDSYPETSCTSMFAYAFARGVQFGWFEKNDPYVRAVFRAWEALNRTSIDRLGNIHGVCRGSEFSFTSEYYKKDLLWNLNDTHGIGIVLLAGVEVLRMSKFLGQ